MDKKTIKSIRNKAWKVVWDEFKKEITMKDLVQALSMIPTLPTFFRVVKEENRKGRSKNK